MSVARVAVLALAAVAAIFVAIYVRNSSRTPPAPAPAPVAAAPAERVLVAKRAITRGERVSPADMGWQEWPKSAIGEGFLTESGAPKAIETYAGAVARVDVASGEPLSDRKLINPGAAGYLAAVLAPGHRAVAVEVSAETGAGGFILPGDQVDVIVAFKFQAREGRMLVERKAARTVIENVRVLAIDQAPAAKEDAQAVVGRTATLELAPQQAELLALAELMGDVSLALRGVADVFPGGDLVAGAGRRRGGFGGMDDTVTIYRFGQAYPMMLPGGAQ